MAEKCLEPRNSSIYVRKLRYLASITLILQVTNDNLQVTNDNIIGDYRERSVNIIVYTFIIFISNSYRVCLPAGICTLL